MANQYRPGWEDYRLKATARAQELIGEEHPRWAKQVAEEFNVGEASVRRWVRDERITNYTTAQKNGNGNEELLKLLSPGLDPLVNFIDQKITNVDVFKALDVAELVQQVVHSARPGQHTAHIRIVTDEPYVLGLTADWHLWSIATDHAAFRRDLNYVLATDHLGIADLGDGIDNFHQFKSVRAVVDQVFPPDVQKALFSKILRALADQRKLLFRTWSNHQEGFDERVYGGSIDEFNKLCPFLEDDGDVTLEIGTPEKGFAVYVISAKHIPKGNSLYHENHANKRRVRFEKPNTDIAVSAHRHSGPEIDQYRYAGQQRLAIVLGSYKTEDAHSRRFHDPAVPGMVGVVLTPHVKEMVPFVHLDQAVEFRDQLSGAKY